MDTFNTRVLKIGGYYFLGEVGYDGEHKITDVSSPAGCPIVPTDAYTVEDIKAVLEEQLTALKHPVIDLDEMDLDADDRKYLEEVCGGMYRDSVIKPIFLIGAEQRKCMAETQEGVFDDLDDAVHGIDY